MEIVNKLSKFHFLFFRSKLSCASGQIIATLAEVTLDGGLVRDQMCMLFTSVISCRGMALCANSVAFPRQDNSWTCSQKMWQLDATSNSHPLEPVYGTWFVDLPQYIYHTYIYILFIYIYKSNLFICTCWYICSSRCQQYGFGAPKLPKTSPKRLDQTSPTQSAQPISQFFSYTSILQMDVTSFVGPKLIVIPPWSCLLICDLRWLEDRRCWAVIRHVPSPSQKEVGS